MVNCHFVPKFYMKVFGVNEKETIRHDKKTGRIRKVSVESFCLEHGFFCFE